MLSIKQAYAPFKDIRPKLPYFHDASPMVCTYKLTAYHAARAMERAVSTKIFDFEKFDLDECEYYENVENGDLNWTVPGKFISF